jgi:hypothetical protein
VVGKPQRWTKWFFSDWLADAGVRSVSLEARGLWIDMLALMDQAPRRGYLQHANGRPMTTEQLAVTVGSSVVTVSRLLQELEHAGVYSSDVTETIYSRRMVKDQERLSKRRVSIRSSFGHHSARIPRKPGLGGLSSSTLESLYPRLNQILSSKSKEFSQALKEWLTYKREKHQNYAPTGLAKLLQKLEKLGDSRAIVAIEHSIASNYAGIFEPDGRQRTERDRLHDSLDEAERRLRGL